jgi:hypothetical protein
MNESYAIKYAINFPPHRVVTKFDRQRDAELAFLIHALKTAPKNRQDCPEVYIRIHLASPRFCKPVIERLGQTHTADFTLIFCSDPDCENFCETEENLLPTTKFVCRDCNKTRREKLAIQHHQFDKLLRGHAPEGAKTPGAWSTKRELKKFLDGNDTMMNGHQILKDRRIDKDCPTWLLNRFEFLNFLCQQFPKWLDETNPKHTKHREEAALYAGVMYYYYRMGLPDSYVSELLTCPNFRVYRDGSEEFVDERKVSVAKVKRIVLAIKRRYAGLRADGTKPSGKRGRPRIQSVDTLSLTKASEMLAKEGVI